MVVNPGEDQGLALRFYGILLGLSRQFASMLAGRITLPHFLVSAAMCLPNSADEPGSTVKPRSSYFALMSGRASPALISLLSSSTISAGIFFGPARPPQLSNAYSGKYSAMVGTSGSADERVTEDTVRARTCPPLICGIESVDVANCSCI